MLVRLLICMLLTFSSATKAELNDGTKKARNNGIALYNQGNWDEAQTFLRKAAEAGDRDAQYYLGETLRLSKRFMSPEAQQWYTAAAEQGDIHAMLRLASKEDLCNSLSACSKDQDYWKSRAREEGLQLASQGDPQAMVIMFNVTGDPDWLKKAAQAGSPSGQYQLANYYKAGHGWFFLPGEREEESQKWYEAAAEHGHALSMLKMMEIAYETGDRQSARQWLEKSADTGLISAVSTLGANLAHEPDQMGFPMDLVKGYALLHVVAEVTSDDSFEGRLLDTLKPKMTAEQLNQATAYANQWKSTHPPLSYFNPRFGF